MPALMASFAGEQIDEIRLADGAARVGWEKVVEPEHLLGRLGHPGGRLWIRDERAEQLAIVAIAQLGAAVLHPCLPDGGERHRVALLAVFRLARPVTPVNRLHELPHLTVRRAVLGVLILEDQARQGVEARARARTVELRRPRTRLWPRPERATVDQAKRVVSRCRRR